MKGKLCIFIEKDPVFFGKPTTQKLEGYAFSSGQVVWVDDGHVRTAKNRKKAMKRLNQQGKASIQKA